MVAERTLENFHNVKFHWIGEGKVHSDDYIDHPG
jgi:hypothetical protein